MLGTTGMNDKRFRNLDKVAVSHQPVNVYVLIAERVIVCNVYRRPPPIDQSFSLVLVCRIEL